MFKKLSEREEYLASQVVDIATYELFERQISFQRQQEVPIIYKDLKIGDGLRLDLLVDDLLIVELKAQENSHPVWEAQMLSYLKLADKRLGLLINFHVPLMKDGIKRLIL